MESLFFLDGATTYWGGVAREYRKTTAREREHLQWHEEDVLFCQLVQDSLEEHQAFEAEKAGFVVDYSKVGGKLQNPVFFDFVHSPHYKAGWRYHQFVEFRGKLPVQEAQIHFTFGNVHPEGDQRGGKGGKER